MKKKFAIITGVTGQDGSHLSDFLLAKNYKVVGITRRKSSDNLERVQHNLDNKNFILETGDITDESFLSRIIKKYKPLEFYNLAAQSFVPESWNTPIQTTEIDAVGVLKCLEAIRRNSPKTKFYQASSSEMFGKVSESPQNELTPFNPRSPYGVAKCYGYYITKNYRESFGVFACNGILFNHEGPRRGKEFVTRKITHSAAMIKSGMAKELRLGNLNAKRDWGYSADYMEAAWLMLQQKKPDDYVIGTGENHSVKEFCKIAFNELGLDYRKYVKVDKKYFRPAEVHTLLADSSKARKKLKWKPKASFKGLVRMMVMEDYKQVQNSLL